MWREEGNHIRRGPFPAPIPEVSIRELSVEDEGDGITYLKIEPLHAPSLVYETGKTDPTKSSSPVPTPTRFEAKGLCYRFMALDPEALTRFSEVKEWTAKLRLKQQLHNRGDHYEVELLALPQANGIVIRYTTDGSSPANSGFATYDGMFRVPEKCRVVCAVAICPEYDLVSEQIKLTIPQQGQEARPTIDPKTPARWMQQTKLDDSGAVWDLIQRLEKTSDVRLFDIGLTAESTDGQQSLEYSGAIDAGYDHAGVKSIAEKLQEIVGGGGLRMSVGSLGFPTGQALLDWLKSTNQQFNAAKVKQ